MSAGRRRNAARAALLVALAVFASSCYAARFGFWPPAERLPELRPGVSSKAEVESLLGAPVGRGAARFDPEMPRREVWAYGFVHYSGVGTSFHQGSLIVFFDDGRYDGHMWMMQGSPPPPSKAARP